MFAKSTTYVLKTATHIRFFTKKICLLSIYQKALLALHKFWASEG